MKVILGSVTCHLDNLAILSEVGNVQVESDAALLGSFHIAGATQLHVLLGDDKAVVGLSHHLQAVTCIAAQIASRHEDTVTLIGPTPYPAPQLVQLREAETLGILDDHDRGIGDIDTHFDNSSCHEDVRLTRGKEHHLVVFLGGFHATMHHGHVVMRKNILDLLKALLKGMKIEFLILLDEGIYDIGLPTLLEL